MRTTTTVYKFDPEQFPEDLDAKIRTYNMTPKPGLAEFMARYELTGDNLVSDTVDTVASTRTVVRSWPNFEVASAWANLCLRQIYPHGNNYPGQIIDAVVNPE